VGQFPQKGVESQQRDTTDNGRVSTCLPHSVFLLMQNVHDILSLQRRTTNLLSLMLRSFLLCTITFPIFASHGITLNDDLNRTVTLPSSAQRIVSLAPSITETLFALGAGDQVVGVTDFCNYPVEATTKHRVGGVTNPSLETIINLKPDLIILSMEGNVRDDFTKLQEIGIPIFVTNPRTLDGIHKSIGDIGILTGRTEEARQLLRSMEWSEDSLKALVTHEKKVLLIVSLQPLIVLGSKTFLAELLRIAGGKNIAGDSHSTYPTLSREVVVEKNPDVIIVTSNILNDNTRLLDMFPEWGTLNAVRNHRVCPIDPDIISRPGPRVVNALRVLYNIINEGT
jgi:cobalamin transport system substrate-binding protein